MANKTKRLEFLKKLGVDINTLSSEFSRVVKSYENALTEEERDFISFSTDAFMLPFKMQDIKGSNHPSYENKTFLDCFLNLKRGDENIKKYDNNPHYYEDLKKENQEDLEHDTPLELFRDSEGNCYIKGGNNRLFLMMMLYLADLAKAQSEEEKAAINNKHTYYALINSLPKNKEVYNIFFLLKDIYKNNIKWKFKGNNPDDYKYEVVIDKDVREINDINDLKQLLKEAWQFNESNSSRDVYQKLEAIDALYIEACIDNNEVKKELLKEVFPDIAEFSVVLKNLKKEVNDYHTILDKVSIKGINYANVLILFKYLLKKVQDAKQEEFANMVGLRFSSCKTKDDIDKEILEMQKLSSEIIVNNFRNYEDFLKYYEEIKKVIPSNLDNQNLEGYEEVYNYVLNLYLLNKEQELIKLKNIKEKYLEEIKELELQIKVREHEKDFGKIKVVDEILREFLNSKREEQKYEEDILEQEKNKMGDLAKRKEQLETKNTLKRLFNRGELKNLNAEIVNQEKLIGNNSYLIKIRDTIIRLEEEIKKNEEQLVALCGLKIKEFKEIWEKVKNESKSNEELNLQIE